MFQYVTRHEMSNVIKCITQNPEYDIEQISRKTMYNVLVVKECLRQAEEQGIISNVED